MRSSESTHEEITQYYTTAIDALCEIGREYYTLGRLGDAQHLLRTSLQLLEASEVKPEPRLKLLLLYGQVLIVDHLLTRGNADLLFSTILNAKQIAEAVHDQHGIADALSLLGQAHYFTTVVTSVKSGASPDSPQGQGKYEEALVYQQQALELREALHDTRGVSESYFQIGVVYERWQQYDQAQAYYMKARQIAEQSGHPFEKTEPARHFAIHALRKGNLDQALTLALQALELREEARFKPYLPLDHLLLRDIYLAKSDTVNAQLHSEMASAIASEMGLKTLVSSMPNIRDILAAQKEGA
jgi:tetratricopeptide (TPR) repeat protein